MKRLAMVIAAMVVLVPASLWAQETPGAEVFGGFSLLTIKDSGARVTPIGWQASVTANVTERFGVVGDFGGAYKDDATNCPSCSLYSFLGGVRVGHRVEKATIFAHALYGGTRMSSGGGSETNFTMGYGGGVDINTSEKLAVRIIQFDWLPMRVDNGTGGKAWLNNVMRFGFGVVFKTSPR
jgi:hypothetical protein